jgi:hypothetical protein
MKEVKSWIFRIIYLVLFFALCKTCISDHIEGSSPEKIQNYEKMISDNSMVMAELSNKYKETTIKIMKIPIKTYEFDYTFSLDNTSYTGKVSFNKLPESQYINLYYLKGNPKVISKNPESDLKIEKEKSTSNSNLYWGILFGFLGLLVLISTIAELTKKRVIGNPKLKVQVQPEIETVQPEKNETKKEEPQINKEDPSRFIPPGYVTVEPQSIQTEIETDKSEKDEVEKEEPIVDKEDPRRFMPH